MLGRRRQGSAQLSHGPYLIHLSFPFILWSTVALSPGSCRRPDQEPLEWNWPASGWIRCAATFWSSLGRRLTLLWILTLAARGRATHPSAPSCRCHGSTSRSRDGLGNLPLLLPVDAAVARPLAAALRRRRIIHAWWWNSVIVILLASSPFMLCLLSFSPCNCL